MNISEAQENMRRAYFDGGPGMLVSGLAWTIAAFVGLFFSEQASVFTLFIGGMFIHPGGMALSKLLGRPGNHDKDNPLGNLTLESTFLLFIGIFIAYTMVLIRSDLFFPVMLLVIGGRYLVFATIYGNRLYWGIGGLLALAGMLCTMLGAPFVLGGFLGGGIEIISAVVVMYLAASTDSDL
ncbi:MAG: hypothetical protein AB8G95_21860 [Anaerolineae bacterium]